MHRVLERETIYLVSSTDKPLFKWKKEAELLPGQETIWAKGYFKDTPASMNPTRPSGFGLIVINSDVNLILPPEEAQKAQELLADKIRRHVDWVSKLIVTFSGFSFSATPFPEAMIRAMETQPERTTDN